MLFSKIHIAACIMTYSVSFSYEPKYHSLLTQPNFCVLVICYHQCLYLIHEKLQRIRYDFALLTAPRRCSSVIKHRLAMYFI